MEDKNIGFLKFRILYICKLSIFREVQIFQISWQNIFKFWWKPLTCLCIAVKGLNLSNCINLLVELFYIINFESVRFQKILVKKQSNFTKSFKVKKKPNTQLN